MLLAIVRHDGRFGLVAGIQAATELAAIGYLAIRTGRGWRGVEPPEPTARHARE
jgi:hypothetical protein